jgi:glycosyltransferase involved in cell wall biosynthesis
MTLICGKPLGEEHLTVKISIVIPAYNEASTIEETLKRVHRVPYDKEIIVVDDGSTDGTRGILQRSALIGAMGIRVLLHDRNQGKGAALRTGFKAVTGDVVIIQDADLEQDPDEYPKLLEPIVNGFAEVVYGSRFQGGTYRFTSFRQLAANRFLTSLSNAILGARLSDMETGYKIFTRKVLDGLDIKSNRFGFEPEFTAKVVKRRFRITQVPVTYNPRTHAQGKKINWKDGVKAIFAIFWFRFFD